MEEAKGHLGPVLLPRVCRGHLQQMERDRTSGEHGNTLLPAALTDGCCVAGSEEQMGDVSSDSGCHWATALQDYGELSLHMSTDIPVAA